MKETLFDRWQQQVIRDAQEKRWEDEVDEGIIKRKEEEDDTSKY